MSIPSTPFSDVDTKIFENEYTHAWTATSDLVTINSWLDCSPFVFTLKQQKDGGAIETLDATIFTVDESAMTIKLYTDDFADIGTYTVMYDVSVANFPTVSLQTQSKAFEVFIYSGCTASMFTFDNTAALLTIKHYVGSTI